MNIPLTDAYNKILILLTLIVFYKKCNITFRSHDYVNLIFNFFFHSNSGGTNRSTSGGRISSGGSSDAIAGSPRIESLIGMIKCRIKFQRLFGVFFSDKDG